MFVKCILKHASNRTFQPSFLLFFLSSLTPFSLPRFLFSLPLLAHHPLVPPPARAQVEIRMALAEELPRRLNELEAALTKAHADRMAAREAEFGAESDRRMQDLERTLMQQVCACAVCVCCMDSVFE